jgi:hypothetical protein
MALSAHQQKLVEFYSILMNEVRVRLKFISDMHTGRFRDSIPATLAREICFLQLRMVFEVVAIGILGLHRNTYNIKALEKQWSVNEIMAEIQKLNPNYFPRAVGVKGNFECIVDIEPHPMVSDSFLKTYGRCGGELHRGTLRKVTAGIDKILQGDRPVQFNDIAGINKQLFDLLRIHRIASADLKQHYVTYLEYEPDRAAVFVLDAASPITFY